MGPSVGKRAKKEPTSLGTLDCDLQGCRASLQLGGATAEQKIQKKLGGRGRGGGERGRQNEGPSYVPLLYIVYLSFWDGPTAGLDYDLKVRSSSDPVHFRASALGRAVVLSSLVKKKKTASQER